jgi:hypothetical protein
MTTLYRLAEEVQRLLAGGDPGAAESVTLNEIKIAICQVANNLLKTEYLQINGKLGETIMNGSVLGLYSDIPVTSYKTVSIATLPVKPIKLPRNMGCFSITLSSDPTKEFIPLQMGQGNLINSQPLINELMGHIGYEVFGMRVVFTKDLTVLFGTDVTVDMRLAILDFAEYGDYDPLPVLPEQEWQIKQEVYKLYATEPTPDKLVDSSNKESIGIPIKEQQQN